MNAEEKRQIDALAEAVREVRAEQLAETRKHNQLMRHELYELQHPEPARPGTPRKVWMGYGLRTVTVFWLVMLCAGCATATKPAVKLTVSAALPPAAVLPLPMVRAQALAVIPCPTFVHTNGLTYVYRNCELAYVVTNGPAPVLTNLVLTFFATNDTSVFLHAGNPTPTDIAATTNGFWSARHVWSLQATTDLQAPWTTVGSADRPGCSHGVMTVDNNWGPLTCFRVSWK